jgi:hypothetical protein
VLRKVAPLPERLIVVGAGDPMWRGGLSAPNSVYLHADLPLISADGTSPLLHEVVHVMLRARSGAGGDWIVEGLAELYCGGAGALQDDPKRRAERARTHQPRAAASRASRSIARAPPSPRRRPRGTDAQIRRTTGDARNLDDVVRALVESPDAISLARAAASAHRRPTPPDLRPPRIALSGRTDRRDPRRPDSPQRPPRRPEEKGSPETDCRAAAATISAAAALSLNSSRRVLTTFSFTRAGATLSGVTLAGCSTCSGPTSKVRRPSCTSSASTLIES